MTRRAFDMPIRTFVKRRYLPSHLTWQSVKRGAHFQQKVFAWAPVYIHSPLYTIFQSAISIKKIIITLQIAQLSAISFKNTFIQNRH